MMQEVLSTINIERGRGWCHHDDTGSLLDTSQLGEQCRTHKLVAARWGCWMDRSYGLDVGTNQNSLYCQKMK